MNIKFEKPDEVTGRLTLEIEKADYADEVRKQLLKLQRSCKMPGFRPGHVPMGMIERMYGAMAKGDAVEKAVSQSISTYIKDNNLRLLGSPLPTEGHEAPDIEKQDDFEFCVDMALAPELSVSLEATDEVKQYKIETTSEMVDGEVMLYRRQNGENKEVEAYEEDNDLLRGSLTELGDDGQPKEGGIRVEQVSLMPRYFVGEAEKELFKTEGKKGATVVFSLQKAYEGKDAEIASLLKINKESVSEHAGMFAFEVNTISRFVPAELNEELFKQVFPVDTPQDEDAFRARAKEQVEKQYAQESDYRLGFDLRKLALRKAGEVKVNESIIRRNLLSQMTKDEDKQNIDAILKDYVEEMTWSLVRSHLLEQQKVEVGDDALKEAAREIARVQFMRYGMQNVPEEVVDDYAQRMLGDEKQQNMVVNRAVERAFVEMAKGIVKLCETSISLDDFNKLEQ